MAFISSASHRDKSVPFRKCYAEAHWSSHSCSAAKSSSVGEVEELHASGDDEPGLIGELCAAVPQVTDRSNCSGRVVIVFARAFAIVMNSSRPGRPRSSCAGPFRGLPH